MDAACAWHCNTPCQRLHLWHMLPQHRENMMPIETGARFGCWIVINHRIKPHHCLCRCDCGTIRAVAWSNLSNGKSKSCGCRKVKHRQCFTPEHQAWTQMRRRCLKKNSVQYPNYGGRGISICAQWDSFVTFFADMGPRPGPGYSLDRIDNDGNYGPENCRWATMLQQENNKRNNILATIDGVTQTVTEWCRALNISASSVWNRIHKGIAPEKAILTPFHKARRFFYHGHLYTTQQLAVMAGVKRTAMKERLFRYGWSVTKAMSQM